MSTNPNLMPPVPRDQHDPSFSEIVPFKSKKISIGKSKALVPLMLLALTVVVLFGTRGTPVAFIDTIGIVGTLGIFLSIYYYSGINKAWWLYLFPGALGWVLNLDSVFALYAAVFRHVLPGDVGALPADADFVTSFIAFFFGAGLCEEMVKATPILLALLLTRRLGGVPSEPPLTLSDVVSGGRLTADSLLRSLALRGPLDGMLMGIVGGAAFILSETLTEYVPNEIHRILDKGGGEGLAYYLGLSLVLPRVLQGIAGHMGWAAIFGYFIGLAAKYPSRWPRLIAIGYLTAAVLHALWDTSSKLPVLVPESWGESFSSAPWLALVTIATVLLLVACLLKAKQLERAWGSVSASNDSILVGGPVPTAMSPTQASPAAVVAATPAPAKAVGGLFSGLQTLASTLEGAAGGFIKPAAAPPPGLVPAPFAQATPQAAPPVQATAAGHRFSIGTGTSRYGLEAGRSVDFGLLFGSDGAPAGAVGEVTRHPSDADVLGLKNTGTTPWTTITSEGVALAVPPGKNLRVAAGTRILFGSLAIDMQPY